MGLAADLASDPGQPGEAPAPADTSPGLGKKDRSSIVCRGAGLWAGSLRQSMLGGGGRLPKETKARLLEDASRRQAFGL